MTFLALLSLLLFLAFAIVLIYSLLKIAQHLEKIGNREPSTEGRRSSRPSYLARINFGVRAIEKEVSALGTEAPRLNSNLEKLAGGLQAIKASVLGSIQAVERQGR